MIRMEIEDIVKGKVSGKGIDIEFKDEYGLPGRVEKNCTIHDIQGNEVMISLSNKENRYAVPFEKILSISRRVPEPPADDDDDDDDKRDLPNFFG